MIKKLQKLTAEADIREILKKGSTFLFLRGGGLLVGYLFTYFIAKEYGASVNGLVALAFSLLMFTSVFGRLGIDINLVKFYANPAYWKEEPGIFYRSLLKAFLVASFLSLILYFFRDFFVFTVFKKPQLEPYVFWICLTIPCWVVVLICSGLLRAKRLINWFAFLDTPGRFGFSLLILVGMWFFTEDPLSAIKAHFYGVFALAILALIVAIKGMGRISFKTSHNSWGVLKEGLPMMWSGAMMIFLGWIDVFVLGIYESDENVGIYHVALKIAMLAGFALEGINAVLMPQIAKYYHEQNHIQYKKLIRFATHLSFYITLFVVFIILFFGTWILSLFGEEFVVGNNVLILLLLGYFINASCGPTGLILQMTGYQKKYRDMVGAALMLNIVLNFLLTPLYGYIGAAVATICSMIFWNVWAAIYIKRKLGIISYFSYSHLFSR